LNKPFGGTAAARETLCGLYWVDGYRWTPPTGGNHAESVIVGPQGVIVAVSAIVFEVMRR